MKIITLLRAYHYLAGVLANQQRDLFCGQCSAWNNTLNNAREALKQFEAEHAAQVSSRSPEFAALLTGTGIRLAGLANCANPAGQKKAGNCKLPEGACFVKASRTLLEKI